MKIIFLNSERKINGHNTIRLLDGKNYLGYYRGLGYSKTWCKSIPRRCFVVKQKSRWFTFVIVIHELAHWFVDIIMHKRFHAKCNKWIEKHL